MASKDADKISKIIPGVIEEHPHAALTHSIINAVYEVYNTLGPGFLESVYETSTGGCIETT